MADVIHDNKPFIPTVVADGGDKGKFIFETWGSVEVLDKDGQILPISEIMKAMPSMINRGGVIHLGHSNRVVGKIHDFWKADWVDPDDGKRKIPGIMFKAELFNDYKSDMEARNGVRDGKFRMVSFGGMSWKGEHMEGRGGSAEVMKDLEGWEFALVERGKNPLAYMTTINGVSLAKGDPDTSFIELVKDQRFNNILMSYLMDGKRYSEAISKAKEEYFKVDEKEIRKEKKLRKGDIMPDEDTKDEQLITLEDLKKGYEALEDEIIQLKGLIGEMAEGMMVLTKEMVYPDDLQSYKITKGEEEEEEKDTPMDYKEFGKQLAKELIAEFQANGFTKSGTPAPRAEPEGKVMKKEDGVTEPKFMPEEFDKAYSNMISRNLNKGMEGEEQFSFQSEGLKTMGINPKDLKEGK